MTTVQCTSLQNRSLSDCDYERLLEIINEDDPSPALVERAQRFRALVESGAIIVADLDDEA